MIKNSFTISGITCEACLRLITMLVSEIKSVKSVDIGLSGNLKIVAERNVTIDELKVALKETEYKLSA